MDPALRLEYAADGDAVVWDASPGNSSISPTDLRRLLLAGAIRPDSTPCSISGGAADVTPLWSLPSPCRARCQLGLLAGDHWLDSPVPCLMGGSGRPVVQKLHMPSPPGSHETRDSGDPLTFRLTNSMGYSSEAEEERMNQVEADAESEEVEFAHQAIDSLLEVTTCEGTRGITSAACQDAVELLRSGPSNALLCEDAEDEGPPDPARRSGRADSCLDAKAAAKRQTVQWQEEQSASPVPCLSTRPRESQQLEASPLGAEGLHHRSQPLTFCIASPPVDVDPGLGACREIPLQQRVRQETPLQHHIRQAVLSERNLAEQRARVLAEERALAAEARAFAAEEALRAERQAAEGVLRAERQSSQASEAAWRSRSEQLLKELHAADLELVRRESRLLAFEKQLQQRSHEVEEQALSAASGRRGACSSAESAEIDGACPVAAETLTASSCLRRRGGRACSGRCLVFAAIYVLLVFSSVELAMPLQQDFPVMSPAAVIQAGQNLMKESGARASAFIASWDRVTPDSIKDEALVTLTPNQTTVRRDMEGVVQTPGDTLMGEGVAARRVPQAVFEPSEAREMPLAEKSNPKLLVTSGGILTALMAYTKFF